MAGLVDLESRDNLRETYSDVYTPRLWTRFVSSSPTRGSRLMLSQRIAFIRNSFANELPTWQDYPGIATVLGRGHRGNELFEALVRR